MSLRLRHSPRRRLVDTGTGSQQNDVVQGTAWNFNGTIQVTCDGYRPFETALMRVEGGAGLIVPLHPGDSSGPYPYRVSFNGWDALYTRYEFSQQLPEHARQPGARRCFGTLPQHLEHAGHRQGVRPGQPQALPHLLHHLPGPHRKHARGDLGHWRPAAPRPPLLRLDHHGRVPSGPERDRSWQR